MDRSGHIDTQEVFRVFDTVGDPTEPLSTEEVASAVGCELFVALATLDSLGSQDLLKTKLIGDHTRVWWRPLKVGDLAHRRTESDSTRGIVRVPGEDTLIEQILEASPVSIVVVDPSGKIEFANGRAEEMLGLERSEITSRTYSQPEWNIYHEDGTPVPVDEHPITRILKTKQAVYGFEHGIELPDGTERWLSSNSAPVLNATGDVDYIIVGIEDATALKDREDKLTSEETRLIELSSKQLFEPFVAATDAEFQIDFDEVVRLPDGTALEYLTATGIPIKTLREVFAQDSTVLDTNLLQSTDESCRLEVHVGTLCVPLVFEDLGGQAISLMKTQSDGSAALTGKLPGDIDLRTALRELRCVYSDFELVSHELNYSPRLLYTIVQDALTEKQLAAVQIAYYSGYFETPRTSSGDELADRLGITRQTYNRHLRKAEQAVFEQLFEASGKAHTD
ncbi:helix-turn-helix domain-containing protein [Halohasta salina]|uniref:helix-turn-helix domain-containing protein n=1 Tax=Halohasta salina TaxID=2961621 RepID=UPI0020A3D886|nr:bacterio-opsin activator domain-containing protein [Halohasta salina]